MKKVLSICAVLLCSMSVAHAQPGAATPPPTLQFLEKVNADVGVIFLRESVQVPQFKEIEEKIMKDGIIIIVKKRIVEHVSVDRIAEVPVRTIRVFTADGKKMSMEDVLKIKPGTVVVVSVDGDLPAAAYLKVFRPDTPVIVRYLSRVVE